MRYRQLGTSDLHVSEIALGSWLTMGTHVEREAARTCLDRAMGAGVNFIDTANVYGFGAAESFLGEALAGRPRDSYLLATKLLLPKDDGDRGLSAAQVRKQLDASLRRLRTDHVDLYQCHRYDPDTPLEETMRALGDAVRAGKVRWLGFSEWTAAQIRDAARIAAEEGLPMFVSSQPQYSMLWRDAEPAVLPTCAELGIGQIVFSPLAQGALTGKYAPGAPPPADARGADPTQNELMVRRNFLDERVLAAVQRLRPIAAELGVSMAQLALAWVLRLPEVSAAIIGASRPAQVDDNVAASGVVLPDDVVARIEAITRPVAHGT